MTEEAVNTVAHALASDLHQRLPARAALRALGYVEPTTDVAGSTPAAVSTVAGSIPAAAVPGERGVDPAEEVQREQRPSELPRHETARRLVVGARYRVVVGLGTGSPELPIGHEFIATGEEGGGWGDHLGWYANVGPDRHGIYRVVRVSDWLPRTELELLLKGWKHYAEPTRPEPDAHPFDHARYAAERAGWVKLQRCIFEVEMLLKNSGAP